MKLAAPISFVPLFQSRVWGGRNLESLFRKHLPSEGPIGESWEVVDREKEQSVVKDGELAGSTLGELWANHREAIFGKRHVGETGRFPLLVKLLDAQDVLSVQVHPPADVAPSLGGEPKTEMWHLLHATPEAGIYAGLKRGVTREAFAAALEDGSVEKLLHRIPVKAGDTIFIPSGRVHAIGAGCVIAEIQQNSDTTYRVFDWNRVGLDGKPRELHIEESLKCIDFTDEEPSLQSVREGELVRDPLFLVEKIKVTTPVRAHAPGDWAIFFVLEGQVTCGTGTFGQGEFFLLPACLEDRVLQPAGNSADLLRVTIPPAC